MDDEERIKPRTVSGRLVVAVILIGGFLLAFVGLRYRVSDPTKLPGATRPSVFNDGSAAGSRAP